VWHVSQDLIERLRDVGERLSQRYRRRDDRDKIRQKVTTTYGNIRRLSPFSSSALAEWTQGRPLVAVDGSVNSTGGTPPHTLVCFQALAKSSHGAQHWAADVHTPLLEEGDLWAKDEGRWRSRVLAELELAVARKAVEADRPRAVLMDGSLFHYHLDAPDAWAALKEAVLERDVLLIGVSEEIGTTDVARTCVEGQALGRTDREVLYGVLEPGECFWVDNLGRKQGFRTVFARTSHHPQCIGIDLLLEQRHAAPDAVRLVMTLTPSEGRGIPLWLDIVDRDVRITDKLVEALVDQYLDPAVKRLVLSPKRRERPY